MNIRSPIICHLTSVHPPFDTRIFYRECRTLADAGYQVYLVAPHVQDETKEGIRILSVPVVRSRPVRMTKTVNRVRKLALQVDADLYHFHDSELIPVGLYLLARGKTVIYDIHEDVPRDFLSREYLPRYAKNIVSWLIERFEHFAASRYSAIVTATPQIGKRFVRFNPSTSVVNNYPHYDELKPLLNVNWADRAQAVTYVGSLAQERGVVQMIQAMDIISEELKIKLELAGTFSPLQFRNYVKSLSGWPHVIEHGQLNRSEVANLLSRARVGLVVLHPLPNFIESQPTKLFEYMAAGIPVIASDFPLWRKIIHSVGCGLLVDPLDPRAIAEAIEYLVTNPSEAQVMGSRGQKAIQETYNWSIEFEKLKGVYENLCGR